MKPEEIKRRLVEYRTPTISMKELVDSFENYIDKCGKHLWADDRKAFIDAMDNHNWQAIRDLFEKYK